MLVQDVQLIDTIPIEVFMENTTFGEPQIFKIPDLNTESKFKYINISVNDSK